MFKQRLLSYVCSHYALRTPHSDTVLRVRSLGEEYANLYLCSSPGQLECQLLTCTDYWEVHTVF